MATKQKTILVVDDEPFFREEVVAFLNGPTFAARGWTVEAAVGGEEALARLDAQQSALSSLQTLVGSLGSSSTGTSQST